jgi:hypothetical protein
VESPASGWLRVKLDDHQMFDDLAHPSEREAARHASGVVAS